MAKTERAAAPPFTRAQPPHTGREQVVKGHEAPQARPPCASWGRPHTPALAACRLPRHVAVIHWIYACKRRSPARLYALRTTHCRAF